MSIQRYEIANRIQSDDLRILHPPPGAKKIRLLLLAADMQKALLTGPWNNQKEKNRLSGQLRADCVNFITNEQRLRVSLGGRESTVEDMKRLENVDEVWELKSKDKNGVRVFGRFIMHNAFLATHWQWRKVLGRYGSNEWGREVGKSISIWEALFPTHQPHRGEAVNDYLSDAEEVAPFYGRENP